MGTFAEWQPRYAERGVATFPVSITADQKKPRTAGYLRTGLGGSALLAIKFAEAQAFGFACGPQNRLTIVDMDDSDERIIDEAERLFGVSPLLWRTGGGKYAAAYRFNGERRRIRPIRSLPTDLLGGGFVVAPPSAGAKQPYEIIRGTLADLDCLPVTTTPTELAAPPRERIPEGRRNVELFKYCQSVVAYCDTLDQLIDAAATWADQQLAAPLPDAEIVKTCNSVWKYQGGRRMLMHRVWERPQFEALATKPEILGVVAFLVAENGPDAQFMIADGLAAARRWPRRLVPAARKMMLKLGIIRCVRPPSKHAPGLYRWQHST